MKNKLYKLFSVSIIALIFITGCQSREGKVNKIKKQEEFVNNSEEIKPENINNYYGIAYSKFEDSDKASKYYKIFLKNFKSEEYETQKINEDKNSIEVFTYDNTTNEYYYGFIIVNKNEVIEVYDLSYGKEATYMEDIIKEFRKYVSKYSTLKEAFDEYSKYYNLTVETGDKKVIINDELGQMDIATATNVNTVLQYEKNLAVEKVVLDKIELSDGKVKTLMVAKSKDNKKVWTLDLGVTDKKENYKENTCVLLGKKYAYVAYGNTLEARDISTGKLIWVNSQEVWSNFSKIIETNNGVYLFTEGMESDYVILKYSLDGKYNDMNDVHLDKIIEKKYIINLDTAESVGDNISINVYENSKYTNVIGKLVIDTNTGKSNFIKK